MHRDKDIIKCLLLLIVRYKEMQENKKKEIEPKKGNQFPVRNEWFNSV